MKTKSKKLENYENKALGSSDSSTAVQVRDRKPVLDERLGMMSTRNDNANSVLHIKHDPTRIRAWHGHNRDYSVLSKERCSDLIEGFQTSDQQFPAIVRKIADSKEFDYEFICGARRHWTASFLKRDLLIEIRELDDKEAFMLQDIENRDREDVSDYERAIDYKKALPIYFDGEAKKMADQLHIDKGNFSRLLGLAELPKPIVDAYGDIRELVTRHGVAYGKLLKDPKTAERVISAAKRLKGKNAKGVDVLKKLTEIAEQKTQISPANSQFSTKYIDVKEGQGGNYTVKFKVSEEGDEEAVAGIKKSLQHMLNSLSVKPEQNTNKESPETVEVD